MQISIVIMHQISQPLLGKEMTMIIIELISGIALFYITGIAIAKTVMYFNPDPEFGDEQ